MTTQKITEIGVTFYKAGGHKHDGITSSLIDTSKYSIFDFDLAVSTDNGDTNRELRRQNNRTRFDQYVARFVTSQVLEPAGIVLPPDSVRGVNIGADEITANNIAANTITANEIAAGTITSNLLVTDFAVVNSTIRSNNFTYDAGNGTGNGWAIYSNGDAIFNNGTFSGKIDVGGLDTSSFHVDTGGNVWAGRGAIGTFGATSNATGAPFQVLASGNVSLAYGALQAFNNSVIRCNASLISFTGGSGTTLSVDGSISSTFNITASGNITATNRIVASNSILSLNGGTYSTYFDGSQNLSTLLADYGGILYAGSSYGQTVIQMRRMVVGATYGDNPSTFSDQMLQLWNRVPIQNQTATTKGTVAGIGFAVGQVSASAGGVIRTFPSEAVEIGIGTFGGGAYGKIVANAYLTSSSIKYKSNVEYLPKQKRSKSINRIRNLKPAKWDGLEDAKDYVLSNRFIDINKRWVERGKMPLQPRIEHYEKTDHNCEILNCEKDTDGVCFFSKKDKNRHGFIAEDVANIFPEATHFAINGDVLGIDYSAIVFILVETAQELLDKIEFLEEEISKLKN